MAEENEKDNFWLYIGGLIVLVIALVFMLKSRETQSVQYDAYSEQQKELAAQQAKEKGKTYGE